MFYWLVFSLSLIVVLKFSRTDFDKSVFCKFYVLLIISIGVFRDTTIGTDIWLTGGGGYYRVWNSPFSRDNISEYGFLYLTYVIKTFVDSYYFYYGSIFALTMALYFFTAKKMGINAAVFFAIFFMSSSIVSCYNIIRQTLALSAATMVYSYLLHSVTFDAGKETWRYRIERIATYEIVILLLSSFFHTSVIILSILPLFHIRSVRMFLSKDIVLWVLLFTVVFINVRYKEYVQLFIIASQETLKIGGRAEFWAEIIERYGDDIESSHGVLSTIIAGSIAILASRGRRNVLFCIGFIGLMLSHLASTNLGIVGRMFTNISFYLYLYYAQIFGEIMNSYKLFSIDVRWGMVVLLLLNWASSFYFGTILNSTVSPYKTYLF